MNFMQRLKVIKLLLIKNWKIRLHNKLSFILLLLLPIVFALIIVLFSASNYYRYNVDEYVNQSIYGKPVTNYTISKLLLTSPESVFQNISFRRHYSPLDKNGIYISGRPNRSNTLAIAYTPINSYTKKLMNYFESLATIKLMFNNFKIIGANNSWQLNKLMYEIVNENDTIQALYGIEFVMNDYNEKPKQLTYKLSIYNENIHNRDFYRNLNNRYNLNNMNLSNNYLYHGFCQIQVALDLAYISISTNNLNLNDINIFIQKMPIPERKLINTFNHLRSDNYYFMLPIILIFSLLVMLPVIVKRIVEEKATRITDYLVILGIGKTEYWISIIIDAFVILSLQNIIIAFIADIPVIEYSNYVNNDRLVFHSHSILYGLEFSLFITFLVIFLVQSILFSCLISVFFRSPNIAVIATIITWILSFIIPISYLFLYIGIISNPKLGLWGLESLSCLIPTCAMFWFIWISIGLDQFADFGAIWYHFSDTGFPVSEMSLKHVLLIMLVSYPLYGIMIWYLSSIITSKHAIAQPFYFPFLNIYKFYKSKVRKDFYEAIFDRSDYSIIIKDLNKKYKSNFGLKSESVLKNIDLDIVNNSITVILGPNGSGKTTLINIITGLIDTKGQVIICGHNIAKDRQSARNVTGICPQENVYYKYLTVREHLQMFYELKIALRDRNDGYNCEQLIQLLDLKSDLNKEAFKLSGGTLRRLVLGMALIGPNDVFLLDEPTAGLDPKVRRRVWDLIIETRNNSKTVLITSHHLEEANVLSDKIVIIADGKVKFKGSTLKMKKEFNAGYQLKLMKSQEFETESDIRKIISKYTKITSFDRHVIKDNEELHYGLSFEGCELFSEMFDELEIKASVLAINNISLGMTTLEDSYAKIISNKDVNFDYTQCVQMDGNNDCLIQESLQLEARPQTYFKLVKQITGIFIKRFNYFSKHYILILILIIIPIFFISLFFVSIEVLKYIRMSDTKSLLLKSESIYGNSMKAFIATNHKNFENKIFDKYSEYLDENDITQQEFNSDNIQESLLLYSSRSLYNYYNNLLYGLSINKTNDTIDLIVWYNYAAYHSIPISLNLMTNALLRQLTNDKSYEINIFNTPNDDYVKEKSTEKITYNSIHYYMFIDSIFFMSGFTFTFASYVLLPINELRTKFKLLQLMSGLNPIVYWLSNFLFDFTIHAICSLFYASVYHILDNNLFFIASKHSFICTYLMFTLYGFAFIPFAYLLSFFSKKPSTGFTFISLYNIIGSPIAIILFLLLSFGREFLIIDIIKEFPLMLCPNAIFLFGINSLHRILGYNTNCHLIDKNYDKYNYTICSEYCLEWDENGYGNGGEFLIHDVLNVFLSLDIIQYSRCHKWINPISYLSIIYIRFISYGLIYFAIILIIETRFCHKILRLFHRIPNNNNSHNIELEEYESEEVKQESLHVSQLVRTGDLNTEAFIVHKLSKQFKKSLIVPNKLSFTVHKEECFGLLGINGSGKTTTFRLITGDLSICSGNAYLGSNANLLKNKREFYSRIGYCPQNDALLDRLTGMQTLKFFGYLRGIESNTIERFVANIVQKFGLKNIINKRLSTYSGGNRRKISLAIALIGTPSLLLLDEPTTGVDPESRFKIWQLLRDLLINYKTSILLTSHNMEECEALCSRLAILSNGVLKTIGFLTDLKNSFAKGFIIILKVNINTNENVVEELKAKVFQTFGDNCVLKYENLGVIYYHLVLDNIKLSQIFKALEVIKSELNLEDYFVSNASLEQAFLSLVEH